MAIVEQHVSPDGLLKLIVNDKEWTTFIEAGGGEPFHTHGDILYPYGYEGMTPEEATQAFVKDILGSRWPIVIWRLNGAIRAIEVPYEVDWDDLDEGVEKHGLPKEDVEVRYWNGEAVAR